MMISKYKYTLFLIFTFFSLNTLAQDPWSWILGRDFQKIEVQEDGIYRITYQELANSGFPVEQARLDELQLYRRGVEVAIRIFDQQNDGFLDPEDYIEFYGQRNDGGQDEDLFVNSNDHIDPYESIYSHASYYFLSFLSDGNAPQRVAVENIPTSNSTPSHPNSQTLLHQRRSFSSGQKLLSSSNVFNSIFNSPRAWTSYTSKNNTTLFAVPAVELIKGVRTSTLNLQLLGFAFRQNQIQISVGNTSDISSHRLIDEVTMNAYEASGPLSYAINDDDFSTDTLYVSFKDLRDGVQNTDQKQFGIAYLQLAYPSNVSAIDASNLNTFETIGAANSSTYNIQNANSSTSVWDISDQNSPILIEGGTLSGTTLTQEIDGINANRTIWINEASKTVSSIERASFPQLFSLANMDYLMIAHETFYQAGGRYNNVALAYKEYRESADGGSHQVHLSEIEEIYNTFSYGEVNPIAIRRYIDFMIQNAQPKYLLLIGNGMELTYQYENNLPQSANWGKRNFIPTFGYPGSDIAFSYGLNGQSIFSPALSVSRLSLMTAKQLADYLEKVREHDNLLFDDLWRKSALHLSGGYSDSEKNTFSGYVNNYKDHFEDVHLGGQVESIARTSAGEVEFIDVTEEINNGVSIVTFFGHSSATYTDVYIGPSSNFNNIGKYPLILMNGCGGGNIFTNQDSWSEDWIRAARKGAIFFLGKSNLGFSNKLNVYSDSFYELAYNDDDFTGVPFGEVYLKNCQDIANTYSSDLLMMAHVEQFTLQGDPALVISPQLPDYSIVTEDITIASGNDDIPLNAKLDFYQITANIKNFGWVQNADDELLVTIRRVYSTGETSKTIVEQSINAPYNAESYQFTFPNSEEDKAKGGGPNRFIITIQSLSGVNEYSLLNNEAEVTINLPINAVQISSPGDFTIVNESSFKVFGYDLSSTNQTKSYILEVDTDPNFSSTHLRSYTTTGIQDFSWDVQLPVTTDSTVYYCRSKEEGAELWSESNFNYISNSEHGWLQKNQKQFSFNTFEGIDNTGTDTDFIWDYLDENRRIRVSTAGTEYTNPDGDTDLDGFFYEGYIDGEQVLFNAGCYGWASNGGYDKLMVMAFNQNNGKSITSEEGDNWSNDMRCGTGDPKVVTNLNYYSMVQSPVRSLYNLLINEDKSGGIATKMNVNENDYVLIFTTGDLNFTEPTNPSEKIEYHKNLLALSSIGIDTVQFKTDHERGKPFIAFGQYLKPNSASIIHANTKSEVLTADFEVPLIFNSSQLYSTLIGPSKDFQTLKYQINDETTDDYRLKVLGYQRSLDGSVTFVDTLATYNNLSNQDVSLNFPDNISQIQLLLETEDITNLTPPQLKNWAVKYTPQPEGILIYKDPDQVTENEKRNFQQGEHPRYSYIFKNLTPIAFEDSISVLNLLDNRDSIVLKIPPVEGFGQHEFEVDVDTWKHQLEGKVPMTTNANYTRIPEELHFNNNSLFSEITVNVDNTNPLLDVTFDHRKIIDGDLVAGDAHVLIGLKDENPFLLKEDIDSVKVFFNKSSQFDKIPIDLSAIDHEMETSEDNYFKLSFDLNELVPLDSLDSDGLLKNGTYTIEVVAADVSGNFAGSKGIDNSKPSYRVSFEVDKNEAISHFYPYPNPFSDNCRFVFRLTGTEVPDNILIQIMTVTGRVVKEIDLNELGTVHIGDNVTNYAWDGTDEFGDRLANGVYLYKVTVLKNGATIEHMETSADYMFKNQIGKLYILR